MINVVEILQHLHAHRPKSVAASSLGVNRGQSPRPVGHPPDTALRDQVCPQRSHRHPGRRGPRRVHRASRNRISARHHPERLWAVVLGGSLALRAPVAGFVIGEVLGDRTGWRDEPAIVRLSDRLTLVMLAPMLIRLAVQVPLYLAGAVGWLGLSRVVVVRADSPSAIAEGVRGVRLPRSIPGCPTSGGRNQSSLPLDPRSCARL